MSEPPKSQWVRCPECGANAVAVIPSDSEIEECEEDANGKAVVHCRTCGEEFLVYYRTSA